MAEENTGQSRLFVILAIALIGLLVLGLLGIGGVFVIRQNLQEQAALTNPTPTLLLQLPNPTATFTPIKPAEIFALIEAGWNAERSLRLLLKSINGMTAYDPATRKLNPAFFKILDAFKAFQDEEALGIRREVDGDEVRTFLYLRDVETNAAIEEALDVFEKEPLPKGSALWNHPRVTITPHNAAVSDPRAINGYILRQIKRHRAGEPLDNVVDRAKEY